MEVGRSGITRRGSREVLSSKWEFRETNKRSQSGMGFERLAATGEWRWMIDGLWMVDLDAVWMAGVPLAG
jgi:hypothetical protein